MDRWEADGGGAVHGLICSLDLVKHLLHRSFILDVET